MKPLLLHPSSILMFLFALVISTNMPTSLRADSSQFVACNNNTLSCGSVTNLTYPFWGEIGNVSRPNYCGGSSLEVKCEHGAPKFTVGSVTYRILAWDIKTQNLTVARDDYLSASNICPSDYKNNTLDNTVLRYDDGLVNVSLLYDCTGTQNLSNPYMPQSCGITVYVVPEDTPSGSCTRVVAPVSTYEYQVVTSEASAIQGALREGFGLKLWSDECSTCVQSGGKCGSNNDGQFACFCEDGPHKTSCSSDSGSSSKLDWRLKTAVGASAAGVGVIVVFAVIMCYRKGYFSLAQRRLIFDKAGTFTDQNVEDFITNYGFLAPKRYSYSEVKRITTSFCDQLGQGGYGVVYKGRLPDGRHVAVKVISKSKGSGEEFINEVASISKTSHVNIVSLLGFCNETNKRALIYEFMLNGSLDKFIYQNESPTAICNLDWNTLYQIAIGIARGLEYLHRGCGTRILHLDIKPQNILLDEDFCPKISDFGLAKICLKKESIVSISGTRGTIGYIAPEVFSRTFGGISHKSDIYSYGMLILEMVGGRKNYENEGSNTSEVYFPDWIYKDLEQGNIPSHICSLLSNEENEMIKKISLVSLWCIQTNPRDRPSINKVIEMLEGPMHSVPFPPKPFLYSPARLPLQISHISSSNMDKENSMTMPTNGSIESNEVKIERL